MTTRPTNRRTRCAARGQKLAALVGSLLACLVAGLSPASPQAGENPANPAPERIKVLFLGDNGHHRPAERLAELIGPLAERGIDVAYTDDLDDLNPSNLDRHDALVIYANHTEIAPEQEAALLGYVEGGKGLVVLHCGSYCFLNSPAYVNLVGGQFQSHETGTFTAQIVDADHPAMAGVTEFEAWDETYVHTRLTDDRTVLMVRETADGQAEPWTWVRTQGDGRVFYTASGHDERVFTNPGYHELVAQGIRWAVGRPDFGYQAAEVAFEDAGADIPNYVPGKQWGAQGEPIRRMQKPLSPEESMTHLSVPGGFRVELFASEPDIVKPIAIAWDDRGRAFVAESVDYPNDKQPEGEGHDRITLCEDTDGDGRADRFTVFADRLSIPTSLVFANGGLIVSQAPEMLFLKDTDGDDVADVREVLFTGFHIDDTHAGPSNLRLGLDGWVYGSIGYAGFDGQVGDRRQRFRQGLFRFRPDGSALEFLTSSSNNTWGLGLTETGEVVYSTANGEHSSFMGIPNRAFESVRGWLGKGNDRMADHKAMHPLIPARQVDHFGGFTAAAGHALYTARRFPESYWNRVAFVTEPTGHLVHMVRMEPLGSHYVACDRFNLLASTDEWTSPIVAEVGPDGAVWVLDWYNYIVQHNPTPVGFETGKGNAYETPLRDRTHGRIYRIIDEAGGTTPPLDLASADPETLVETLQHENMFWRLLAQWRLVERGETDVVPALVALLSDEDLDANGENLPALYALHALAGLKATEGADVAGKVVEALRHPSPGVRVAAVEVLPEGEAAVAAILEAGLLTDPAPQVRRAALLVLGTQPASDDAGAAVFAALVRPENAGDRWIPLAATTAGARHAAGFLGAALTAAGEDQEAPESIRTAVQVVAQHLARGDESETAGLASLLASLGDARPDLATAVLEGLAAGWPEGRELALDEDAQEALVAAMGRLGPAGQLALANLATRWGLGDRLADAMTALRDSLAAEVADPDRSEDDRIASARRLVQLGADPDTLDRLLEEVSPRSSPALASGLLDAASQADAAELGTALLERWGRLTPALRRQAIDVLLRRPEWTKALLDGLDAGTIAVSDLSANQAQRLGAHPDRALAERAAALLAQSGRLASSDRQAILDEFLPLASRNGSAERGREVFQTACATCHRHGEMGTDIAPNLTGFSVHPKEKILTEILDPNRSVEGNFRQYTVATADGRVLNGLLASETQTAIELIDSEANRHVVLRDDIEEIVASEKSLMPEGFETQLTPEQITDLLEFIAAKGKYVPIPLNGIATIASDRGMFFEEDGDVERLIFPDWSPKLVGEVPFVLVDPKGGQVPNAILLNGPHGRIPPRMPKEVTLPCNTNASAIHLLSGVSGWGYPIGEEGSTSMIVRLHYEDGSTEDHELKNGVHFADYIRVVDVPGSELAFRLRGQQIRYLAVQPERPDATIESIEFVKGADQSAPIVMAVTVERP